MSELDDPRVLFAAERTLLAWSRTSLTLMTFGFVLERFGLFLRVFAQDHPASHTHGASTWIGLSFVALGAVFLICSSRQYRTVLKSLKPSEIPEGYGTRLPLRLNGVLLCMSVILIAYILYSFFGL